jgi:hypothetical protein
MQTPKVYREAIERVGGLNPFGEPRFILHWGGDLVKRTGLPDVRLAPFLLKAWCLAEWRPPEEFGLVEEWPADILGDFPGRGAYMIRQVFRYGKKPDPLDSSTLNLNVIEGMIKNCLEHEDDPLVEKRLLIDQETHKEEERETARIAAVLEDASPRFKDAVSYARQKITRSAVQQKAEQIERVLRWRAAYGLQLGRGLSAIKS